ncbi:FG-GAP repeat domain-containing protein [Nocardia sp. 004]|uniref:FG-GAP repeat domain-containing protein n=1 Tax=Nocardia sp. 004 TaxID=3385978 RepID=UPI00399F0289
MRRLLVPALSIALCLGTWTLRPVGASDALVGQASAAVTFDRHLLPPAPTNQRVRPVAQDFEPIQPWISAVGASVGSMDLRGQGHAGDACTTDPRDDEVRVFPVPGSAGEQFEPFELRPDGLRYDDTMAPIGCVPADINHDGATDIIVYYWGRSPVLFLNQRESSDDSTPRRTDFEPHELVTPMDVWNTTALNIADIDGDGVLDIMVGNYFPDGAPVLDPAATADSRIQMQAGMNKARNAGTNRLFLGSPVDEIGAMPEFIDVSNRIPEESARSWTLSFGFQDLTGDGLPETYVANDFGPDQLLVNHSKPGDVRFEMVRDRRSLTERRSTVLGHDSFKGMGVAFSYAEGEELPRIIVSNITSPWALQESNFAFYPDGDPEDLLKGEVPFTDRSAQTGIAHSGWSWDIKPIDILNDGRDDLLQANGFIKGSRDVWPRLQETAMGNDQVLKYPELWLRIEEGDDLSGHEPNRLWREMNDQWVDIGRQIGFSDEVSRGIATADVNGDGLRDFVVANQWEDSFAYVNTSETDNRRVSLRVVAEGVGGASTPVIGATVVLEGEDGYRRETQVYPANGHSGVSDDIAHFGIPDAHRNDALSATVTWRQGGELHQRTFVLDDLINPDEPTTTLKVQP